MKTVTALIALMIAAPAMAGMPDLPSGYSKDPTFVGKATAYYDCVYTKTMDVGVKNRDVPAAQVVRAVVDKCEDPVLSFFFKGEQAALRIKYKDYSGSLDDGYNRWRNEIIEQVGIELNSKRLGL